MFKKTLSEKRNSRKFPLLIPESLAALNIQHSNNCCHPTNRWTNYF